MSPGRNTFNPEPHYGHQMSMAITSRIEEEKNQIKKNNDQTSLLAFENEAQALKQMHLSEKQSQQKQKIQCANNLHPGVRIIFDLMNELQANTGGLRETEFSKLRQEGGD